MNRAGRAVGDRRAALRSERRFTLTPKPLHRRDGLDERDRVLPRVKLDVVAELLPVDADHLDSVRRVEVQPRDVREVGADVVFANAPHGDAIRTMDEFLVIVGVAEPVHMDETDARVLCATEGLLKARAAAWEIEVIERVPGRMVADAVGAGRKDEIGRA